MNETVTNEAENRLLKSKIGVLMMKMSKNKTCTSLIAYDQHKLVRFLEAHVFELL